MRTLIVDGEGNGFPQKRNGKKRREDQVAIYILGVPGHLKSELLMGGNGVMFSP